MWSTVKQGVPVRNLWHLNEISSIKKKVYRRIVKISTCSVICGY